jgi:hypothetical protein
MVHLQTLKLNTHKTQNKRKSFFRNKNQNILKFPFPGQSNQVVKIAVANSTGLAFGQPLFLPTFFCMSIRSARRLPKTFKGFLKVVFSRLDQLTSIEGSLVKK